MGVHQQVAAMSDTVKLMGKANISTPCPCVVCAAFVAGRVKSLVGVKHPAMTDSSSGTTSATMYYKLSCSSCLLNTFIDQGLQQHLGFVSSHIAFSA